MRSFSLTLLTLAYLAAPPAARALSVPPAMSYQVTSADGAYVFVMLLPGKPQWDSPGGEELRRTYPQSGLYARGSTRPLWTVAWFSDRVRVANDGTHVVSVAGWHNVGVPGDLRFYANGQLLRSYARAELVDTPALLPDFTWVESEGLDDAASQYVLRTADGNRFVFDLATGEIDSSHRWRRWVGAAAGGMVLLVIAGALGLTFWLRRGKPPALPCRGEGRGRSASADITTLRERSPRGEGWRGVTPPPPPPPPRGEGEQEGKRLGVTPRPCVAPPLPAGEGAGGRG